MLAAGEGLTIRLELPEGYFVGAKNHYMTDLPWLIVPLAILLFCLYLSNKVKWNKREVVETVEFYPPDNLNSADLEYAHSGNSSNKGVISLLIYLANKGFIKITEGKYKSEYKITRIKEDYEGLNASEHTFLQDMFSKKNEVTQSDLKNKFYTTINKISSQIRNKLSHKIYDKTIMKYNYIILIPIILLIFFFTRVEKNGLDFMLIEGLSLILSFFVTIVFLVKLPRRTPYGTEILGRSRGFKNFLQLAEKEKLEELVTENPEYFYNILPYTYALGVSSKWIKKFESIAVEPPDWYDGHSSFNMIAFSSFMDSTITIASSSPSSDGGSGGGFSGGGSGGGGGGSW